MRAVERAYLRVLLDPHHLDRLSAEDSEHEPELSTTDLELLRGLDPETLDVERRARRRHLWVRVRQELPRTLARAEVRLPKGVVQQLRNRLFSEHLWHPERTLPLPVFGRGYEQATHVRDALRTMLEAEPSDELRIVSGLAELERAWLAARANGDPQASTTHEVRLAFDLARAVVELGTPAAALRLPQPRSWRLDLSGTISADDPSGTKDADPSRTALVFAPAVQVTLDSYRINNHIAASLHYLSLGREAHDIGLVYAAMSKARRQGDEDWFESSGAERYFRRERHEVYLNDEQYFGRRPVILDEDLRVGLIDRARPATLHVPVDEGLLEIFGRLLPRLRRSTSVVELEEQCDEEEWDFVQQLEEAGFLQRAERRTPSPREGFGLRFIGHAAVELATPTTRVLLDPLLVVRTRPEVDVVHELDTPIDAIVISHPHWDHFNLDTLLQVPRETRMVVPRLVNPPSLENVDMGALLAELGFTNIHALAPWEQVEIGDVTITAAPFYGEQSGPEVPQDWMTVHVAAGGRSFFAAVDSCHDSHDSMDIVMREARERLGPVDVLFAPYSGFHYPISMFTRRPFYLGPGMEQYSGSPDDAVRWCSLLGASLLVPYAGFVWQPHDFLRPEDQTHRGSLRRLRSLVKSHPRGALLVLEPGGPSIRWQGEGEALEIPASLEVEGA